MKKKIKKGSKMSGIRVSDLRAKRLLLKIERYIKARTELGLREVEGSPEACSYGGEATGAEFALVEIRRAFGWKA